MQLSGQHTALAFDEALARRLIEKFTKHGFTISSNLRAELDLMPLHLVMICSEYEEWTHTVVAIEKLTVVHKIEDLFALLAQAEPRNRSLATSATVVEKT
jgi:hypothetical protein